MSHKPEDELRRLRWPTDEVGHVVTDRELDDELWDRYQRENEREYGTDDYESDDGHDEPAEISRFDADGYDESGHRRVITKAEREFLLPYGEWGEAEPGDSAALREVIEGAEDERPIQKFLEERPHLLANAFMSGGHGRYVRPQVRLGSEWVPDFVMADGSSMGHIWQLVELESPRAPIYLKSGQWAEKTRQALHQIETWRQWLSENIDYARKLPPHGPGLVDIEARASALILIGRRKDLRDDQQWKRRSLLYDLKINIATYDRLLEATEASERAVLRREQRRAEQERG
jgi:hypothetical protein